MIDAFTRSETVVSLVWSTLAVHSFPFFFYFSLFTVFLYRSQGVYSLSLPFRMVSLRGTRIVADPSEECEPADETGTVDLISR